MYELKTNTKKGASENKPIPLTTYGDGGNLWLRLMIKMAKIKGTLTANVTIDASAKELFIALAKEFEIDDIFQDQNREYAKAELKTINGVDTPYIVRYMDMSCHGSPHYEQISERKISLKQYQIAQYMSKIQSMMY